MRPYFEKMSPIGRALKESEIEREEANTREITKVEEEVLKALDKFKMAGIPAEKIHQRGENRVLSTFSRTCRMVDCLT